MNQRAFRFFLFASPISACLVLLGPRLWRLAGESALPQWDMAKYGVSGLRLAGALATFDLPLFLRELNSLSVWPPLFPLLEAPAFLLFGPEPSVASRLVALLFLASLALLPWALSPLAEGGSPAPGLLVAAALAATPFWGAFASLVMLEVPGLLLLVLALGFTLRAIRGEPGAWPAAYLCSTLLFFCKYNYGLLFIVPLLLFRARLTQDGWPSLWTSSLRRLWPILARSPWGILALVLLGGLVWLRFSGGFTLELGGQVLRVRSIGNPLLAGLWLGLLVVLVSGERRRRFWHRLHHFDCEHQGLVRWLLAPIFLWFLLPPHLKDFLGFVENRSSQLPLFSVESLLFYPRVFFELLSPGPLVGAAVLGLAFWGLRRLPGSTAPSFLALWVLIGCGTVFLHPYKQDRFFAHAAFSLLVLAAAVFTQGLERVPGRLRRMPVAGYALSFLVVVASALGGWREDRIRPLIAERSVPLGLTELLDAVLDQVPADSGSQRPVLLGTWNLASPWLLEWRAWQRTTAKRPPSLPLDPRDLVSGRNAEALAARLGRAELVLLLEPFGASESLLGSFAAETAWLSPARSKLEDPELFFEEKTQELAGYRLRTYRSRAVTR